MKNRILRTGSGGLRAAIAQAAIVETGGRDAAATTAKLSLLLLASIAATTLPLTPATAQPPERSTVAEANIAAKVASEWRVLHKESSALQVTDPEKAIAAYKAFYEKRGRLNTKVSVEVSSLIAQIYWHQLNNRTKAGEIYGWAIREYGDERAGARLKKEWAQLQAQTSAEAVHKIDAASLANKTAVPGAKPVAPKMGADTPAKLPAAALPSKITNFTPDAAKSGAIPIVAKSALAKQNQVEPDAVSKINAASLGTETAAPGAVALPDKVTAISSTNNGETTTTAPEVKGVSSASLLATALIAQLQNGEITPVAAWAKGVLTPRDLLSALAVYKPDEKEKRRPLIALLAQHDFQNIETMPLNIQQEIGEYLRDTRDARAVPLFERLAAKADQPGPKASMLYRLAQSHEALGELEKAGDTYVQAAKILQTDEKLLGWSSGSWIEAGRRYARGGFTAKAQQVYAEAKKSPYGWTVGMALWDQANALIEQGRHEEARKLLLAPVKGLYTDQIQIAMHSLLARSYFETGELNEAKKYAQQVVTEAGNIKLLENEGLEPQVELARETLKKIEERSAARVWTQPQQLRFIVRAGEIPARQWIKVYSTADVAWQVVTGDARFEVEVMPESQQKGEVFEREVAIKLKGDGVTKSYETNLTVDSSKLPGAKSSVKVEVEAIEAKQ